ncbi:hypothetical protein [Paenibacillus sp. NPDC058071]|uniref:hypothetical protein n=1 Tax=Paenibacillus sp. NPDC058071 TaxID=3346326 RepID=UPI0036D95CA3
MGLKKMYKRLKKSDKNHFEDIFSNIMKRINGPNFHQTQTNPGDKKVDGVLNGDTVFAVYAPETYKDKEALKKVKSDYEGFIKNRNDGYWSGIKKWIFVIKSPRKGATAPIQSYILNLNGKEEIETGIWTLEDIKKMINDWLPLEIPSKKRAKIKSKLLKIKELHQTLIKDYENLGKNGNSLYHFSEMENGKVRVNLFRQLASLTAEIKEYSFQFNEAFKKNGLEPLVQSLLSCSPGMISDAAELIDAYELIDTEDITNSISSLCDEMYKIIDR